MRIDAKCCVTGQEWLRLSPGHGAVLAKHQSINPKLLALPVHTHTAGGWVLPFQVCLEALYAVG